MKSNQISLRLWAMSQDEPDIWDALETWYYATSNMYTHLMLFYDLRGARDGWKGIGDNRIKTIHKIRIPLHNAHNLLEHEMFHSRKDTTQQKGQIFVDRWYAYGFGEEEEE